MNMTGTCNQRRLLPSKAGLVTSACQIALAFFVSLIGCSDDHNALQMSSKGDKANALQDVTERPVLDTPELTTSQRAIQGGEVDEERTNVVGMVIQQGWSGGACSGSLIAPNLVLTAQHCIAPTSSQGIACGFSTFGAPYDLDSLYVTTRTSFPRFSGYYGVREIVLPDGDNDVCGRDVALLILNQNVPSDNAIPLTPRLDEPVAVGERFTAAGYGHTGNGDGAGTRRSIEGRRVICSGFQNGCQDNNQGVYANEWVGNDGTCQGDSGGPALDVSEKVIGVLSRGPEGCIYPVYTDVVLIAPLIRETATRAAMIGGYQPASWVDSSGQVSSDLDEDGATDRYDNCPEVANPSQQDYDQDGIGDLCDPLISGDRGGICPVCNRCTTDDECGGQGAVCLQLQGGGVCTYPCRGSFECPDTTDCVNVLEGEKYCFNTDILFNGPCPQGYLCGGESPVTPVPADDGACHVCEPCERGEDCASGVCASLGGGPLVCSRSCETDDECREGSACLEQAGRKLCVNVDHAEVGICPAGLVCGASMSQAGEVAGEVVAGEIEAGEVEAGEAEAGEIEAGEVEAGEVIAGEEGETPDVEASPPKDDGCQSAPRNTSSPLGMLALLALLSLRGLTRRLAQSGTEHDALV